MSTPSRAVLSFVTRLCLALSCALSVAQPARADTAVFRPLPDRPAPSAEQKLAQSTAVAAIKASNIRIMETQDARERLHLAAEQPCLEVSCASSVLSVLGADMLVAVSLASDEVLVTLVDENGRSVSASAPSHNGEIAPATQASVNRALSKWPTRSLVSMTVEGTPSGASVTVDGQPRGVLPLEVRVQPGRHELVVTMRGYEVHRQIVEVARNPPEAPRVAVALVSELESNKDGPRWVSRGYLYGGPILAVAGAATMGVVLGSLARTGCEERAPDGSCIEKRELDLAPVAIWTTVGALALAGGVTWFVVGYRRDRPRSAQTTIDVGLTGATLRGSF